MNSQNSAGIEAFIELLEAHADTAAARDEANQLYADQVRRRTRVVEALLKGDVRTVQGVVCTWKDDMEPIAASLFGEDLSGQEIGAHVEYTPTVFPGVVARVRMMSSDEMWGPTLRLDMTNAATQPTTPRPF